MLGVKLQVEFEFVVVVFHNTHFYILLKVGYSAQTMSRKVHYSLNTRKEYCSFMVKFADEYTSDDLTRLKYVSKDYIPAGKMEQLRTALEIFSQFEQQGLLGPNNLDCFHDLVEAMNRQHLLEMLKQFVVETKVKRMRAKIREFKLLTGKEFGKRYSSSEQYEGINCRRMAF